MDIEWVKTDVENSRQHIEAAKKNIARIQESIQKAWPDIEATKKILETIPKDREDTYRQILESQKERQMSRMRSLAFARRTLAFRKDMLDRGLRHLADLEVTRIADRMEAEGDPWIREDRMNEGRYHLFMYERKWMRQSIKQCRYTEVRFLYPYPR
jgi:chromosome segregation ATPase